MNYFENKTILITGASAGIGKSFCHALASRNVQLVITSRNEERLKRLASELEQKYAIIVHQIPCDLSLPGGPHDLWSEVRRKNCEPDILINNAGFGYNGSFIEADARTYEQMMYLNMSAVVILSRLVLPGMIHRKSGAILNVASMAGFVPLPDFAVYAATKQFVINFTWSLWKELKGTGVHAGSLCPGPVDTDFLEVAGIDRKKAAFRGLQSPDEVARKGLEALANAKPIQWSRPMLRTVYLLGKWVPVRVALAAGHWVMKKKPAENT